jgi:hypothetical protein
MGWASANPIFDRTATVLLASGAEDRIVTETLSALIGELMDGDWDTLDESIDEFKNKPSVMAAFRLAAPSWYEEHFVATSDPVNLLEQENERLREFVKYVRDHWQTLTGYDLMVLAQQALGER